MAGTLRWNGGILLLVCLLLPACGSGTSGPQTYSVSGNVTFDGEPVSNGEIIFRPQDEKVNPVAGPIQSGEYNLELPAGEHLVVITASREVPGKFDTSNPGEKSPVVEQFIPEEFNANSNLKTTVVQENSQTHNFDLKSKDK